jgi:RNA polymerase sigma factor (sigma-70 family)
MSWHPSDQDLERYAQGEAPGDVPPEALAAHVASCASCAGMIAFERRMRDAFAPPPPLTTGELGSDAVFQRILRGVTHAEPGGMLRQVERSGDPSTGGEVAKGQPGRRGVSAPIPELRPAARGEPVVAAVAVKEDLEAWFTEHYPFLQRLTAVAARRLGIRGEDAEDFAAWAAMRLWDDDYALLRKWRGDSSLAAYARVVVVNLGREYRVLLWGRWRPSAAALRLGRLAILLEQLVYRDGMRRDEAYEQLRTRGELGGRTEAELTALFAQLPVRPRSRRPEEGDAEVEALADERSATDDVVVFDKRDEEFRERLRALRAAVETLPDLQRVLIELHFFQALTIADVARQLGVEQEPLYRERDRALATLVRRLAEAGVSTDQLGELLGDAPGPTRDATVQEDRKPGQDRAPGTVTHEVLPPDDPRDTER